MRRITQWVAASFSICFVFQSGAFAAENCPSEIGKHIFETKCAMCHSIKSSKGTIVGPNLFGVFDRPIGKLPGFTYTRPLATSTQKWNESELDLFLKAPAVAMPGTAMPFTGIKIDTDRAATICYLKQQR